MRKKINYLLSSFFVVSGEMIEGQGEDSYSYEHTANKGFVGVFDGCGGTGAKRYEKFNSYTGAYLASRMAAYATQEWWKASMGNDLNTDYLYENIQKRFYTLKKMSENNSANITLKGSLSSKTFPTTASIITYDFSKKPVCNYIWAGDSRGYILDRFGLCQVTQDDIDSGGDAYDNIENDARVNNVINADEVFFLNQKEIALHDPCIVFAATDGCFSYIHTPMEFEYLLLTTLLSSNSIYDWEIKLKRYLHKRASDDYTITVLICGFRKFKDIKLYYRERLHQLNREYISKLMTARNNGDTADIHMLWKQYKGLYYRYE